MITGTVDDEGVPVIPLSIAGKTLRAIVDTGFNGDLELPREFEAQLNVRFICRDWSYLAAGQRVLEDIFLAEVLFDGRPVQAQVTFAEGQDALVGTHLLREHRLRIDFVGRTVHLSRDS